MTADQPMECPFCNGDGELDIDENHNHFVSCIECRAEGSRAACASDAANAWNTRPTAVASHAEGDWRMADLWVEYAANGNIRYFTQDPESADVRRESIASEGRELVVYYTHPPRSGDEARDATRWRAARDNQGDGLRLIMWNHKAVEELQVMFPSKSLCEEYADAAMAARGGEKSCSGT